MIAVLPYVIHPKTAVLGRAGGEAPATTPMREDCPPLRVFSLGNESIIILHTTIRRYGLL